MATRKAITLVSGLFQEVNTPTDKLDFAGNTTADLGENTNLYFTNARARSAVSVTDAGGLGSLAYNSSTGVITYTGPSNSDIRGLLSIASGSGLTYNSGTGEFGTSAIPNSQLANDDVTIGSTAVALGATQGTFTGLTSLTSSTLVSGTGSSNVITIANGNLLFSGATGDANGTTLTVTDPTATRTITLPDETGTVLTTGSSIANSNLANSAVTLGATGVALGATASTISGLTSLTATTLVAGSGANSILLASGSIQFEGSTANDFETSLTVTDPTADRTITFPDATGTVALLTSLSIASGSGLTYNSSTGEFSTNAIPNAQLANSSVTVGSTAIALGNSSTTLTGLSSVTSTAVVTNDSGFRIRDNSDNTKQLAFECSGISTSTTRTLTVPDENGTLVTSGAIVNADINASAAIAGSKISPDFGSQAISTTGTASTLGRLTISNANPFITLTDTNNDSDFSIRGASGNFIIRDDTNSAARLTITSGGTATFANNVDISQGLDVTGNITVTGTVDGRDVAADGTKLDGIESNATADQTASEIVALIADQTIAPSTIDMEDDEKIKLGTGDDLQIYHDGSDSFIEDAGTGTLRILSDDVRIMNAAGTEISAQFIQDGEARLKFDNSTKLATKTGGVDVTGNITVSGTVDGVDVATRDTLFGGLTSSSGALTNGVTATTQSASDNSTKVATTAYVDNQVTAGATNEFADNVFRVKDNSDATKKLAFECSGISGSTTRTMTVPDSNGTISTESFATAIAVALG